MVVSWFSGGVSSAVATMLEIDRVDRVLSIHIDDHHADSARFEADCATWFRMRIEALRSAEASSVEGAIRMGRYINGPAGAQCTRVLKRRVRQVWEQQPEIVAQMPITYVWGFDCSETRRAERLQSAMPEFNHGFPLIEQSISKAEAHEILRASGIRRPAMYELGYRNNNCVGCVKGGMGYWNRIRVDFPEVFAARAAMERECGATCINGVYLDELDPERGRNEPPIADDCGIMCEVMALGGQG